MELNRLAANYNETNLIIRLHTKLPEHNIPDSFFLKYLVNFTLSNLI